MPKNFVVDILGDEAYKTYNTLATADSAADAADAVVDMVVTVVVWNASVDHDVDDAGGVQQNKGESVDVVADAGAATVRDYGFH